MTVGAGKLGIADNTALASTGVREGKTGEQVIGQAHGKYHEAALRGNLYAAVTTSAQAPTTALSTTAPFTLYNPLGSNKLLAIKRAAYATAFVSTAVSGSGTLFHTVYTLSGTVASQGGTIPSGSAVTPLNCLVGAAQASIATVLQGVTLHTNNPAILWPFVSLSEITSGTIADNSIPNFEDVDGAIVLGPGSGWAPESISAALTNSPLSWFGVVWEEIPIV